MNVTVYHIPVTALHHMDQIEVDVDGSITSFHVDQPSTTFIPKPILDKSSELHQQERGLIVTFTDGAHGLHHCKSPSFHNG